MERDRRLATLLFVSLAVIFGVLVLSMPNSPYSFRAPSVTGSARLLRLRADTMSSR